MEVIKHGKEYYTKTCEKCGCEFSFASAEVKIDEKTHFNYDRVKRITIRFTYCPECGACIELNKL